MSSNMCSNFFPKDRSFEYVFKPALIKLFSFTSVSILGHFIKVHVLVSTHGAVIKIDKIKKAYILHIDSNNSCLARHLYLLL
jgi:hypothetical protein